MARASITFTMKFRIRDRFKVRSMLRVRVRIRVRVRVRDPLYVQHNQSIAQIAKLLDI